MSKNSIDVTAIGNAIVDVLAQCDDEFLSKNNITKSSMNLIDEERSKFLFDNINSPKVISGGSAANTAVGLASLGSTAAFIGKVKNDELGNTFKRDIEEVGVSFDTPLNQDGPRTASSTILITPDAERSMNTFLGACVNLNEQDIDESLIKKSKLVYLEGYLFDPPQAKDAFRKAAKVAKDGNNLVAITLSDSFCVERHRDDFIAFIENFADILFCNEDEIKSLYECDLESAKRKVEEMGKETVITLGSNGSTVFRNNKWTNVEAYKPKTVIDTTGAGDLFAAGYLHGTCLNLNAENCSKIGSIVASEIISHVGPRPTQSLKSLIKDI